MIKTLYQRLYGLSNILMIMPLLFTFSCSGDSSKSEPKIRQELNRVMLVYMVGESNLNGYCEKNITSMLKGFKKIENIPDIYIYQDDYNNTTLWKLGFENDTIPVKVRVKDYEEQNSSDPEVLVEVMNEVFNGRNDAEKGLILWSHATAWLPSTRFVAGQQGASQRSFGSDRGDQMDVWELREALERSAYMDYIIFDACHMASAEVAFELKDVTKYLIASPTEIDGSGFPYEDLVQILGREELDLGMICDSYMNYYVNGYFGGSISLIDCTRMDELAAIYGEIIEGVEQQGDYIGMVQEYGRLLSSSTDFRRIFFDMEDAVVNMVPGSQSRLTQILEKCVLYSGHTEKFGSLKLENCSGLSVYMPSGESSPAYVAAYGMLGWKKAVYGE